MGVYYGTLFDTHGTGFFFLVWGRMVSTRRKSHGTAVTDEQANPGRRRPSIDTFPRDTRDTFTWANGFSHHGARLGCFGVLLFSSLPLVYVFPGHLAKIKRRDLGMPVLDLILVGLGCRVRGRFCFPLFHPHGSRPLPTTYQLKS